MFLLLMIVSFFRALLNSVCELVAMYLLYFYQYGVLIKITVTSGCYSYDQ